MITPRRHYYREVLSSNVDKELNLDMVVGRCRRCTYGRGWNKFTRDNNADFGELKDVFRGLINNLTFTEE